MTGKLSKNIDIIAALTDENTQFSRKATPEASGNRQSICRARTRMSHHAGDIDVNFANLGFL
jgi:hypothetical protein